MKKQIPTLLLASSLTCLSQSTIDSENDHAYLANAGWLDFNSAASNGLRVTETYLSGYAYAANFGWIHFGSGDPANGYHYANDSATDFGLNLTPDGSISGKAYSANVGWITFEQIHGQAKINLSTGGFTGFAYSANLGWISLDTQFSDLVTSQITSPDSDNDQIADAFEMLHFGDLSTADATSDSDGDGHRDTAEYLANTSPTDPTEFVSLSVTENPDSANTVDLAVQSGAGRIIEVQDSPDLTNGSWGTAKSYLPGSAFSSTTDTYAHPATTSRFFRLKVSRPLQP